MPITLDGTNGITTPMYNGSITANAVTPSVNMKNRIINGAMVIDQRNAGASVATSSSTTIYSLDRWLFQYSQTSKFTGQQNAGSVTSPVGFVNYLGCTSSSAYSVGASENFEIQQRIEGYNIADLGWGTANAKTVTLSFQVYSSLTGTFGGFLCNGGTNYSYPFSYTISTANTWTSISVTIVGPTSGTWLTTNGIGMFVGFSLGAGSSTVGTAGSWYNGTLYRGVTGQQQVVGTNGATFYITGVQLEVGSTATSFDYRPYGTELQLCQRYCFAFGGSTSSGTSCVMGLAFSSNQSVSVVQFPVMMRGYPSLTVATPSNFYTNNLGANTNSSTLTANTSSATTGEFFATLVSSALTTNQPIRFFGNTVSLAIWSAEL